MQPGTVVAGRYVIDELAGFGGMASVYRAHDQLKNRVVAIKVLSSQSAQHDERFRREAQMLQELHHPAIVRYFDSGIMANRLRYLVMEWLEGEDLLSRLKREPLRLAESLTLIGRIAEALQFIHSRRIVHRDIKPANIYLANGKVEEAKLLDFGLARWAGSMRTLTQPGSRFGTPAYMSPEQVRRVGRLNSRTDTFSLGCVLYECLTGEPAFVAHDEMALFCKILMDAPPALRQVIPEVPAEVDELFSRMLAKKPADRPRSGYLVVAARKLLTSLPEQLLRRPPRRAAEGETLTPSELRLVHVVVAAMGSGRLDVDPAATRSFPGGFVDDDLDVVDVPMLFPGLLAIDYLEATPPPPGQLPTPTRGMAESRATASPLERIAQALEPIGARVSELRDGSVIAVLEHASGAMTRTTAGDQAANAARCALRLCDELPDADVVVASGRAVVQNERLVGQVIDRAADLLAAMRSKSGALRSKGEIRLDALTAGLLGPEFEIDGDLLRGFLLRGERPSAQRVAVEATAPFVGRKLELVRLTSSLDSCVETRTATVVLVTGLPGFGKSRLCREFLALAHQREDLVVWFARGDPTRAGSPLHVMADAVRGMAGIVDSQPAALRRLALRNQVARHLPASEVERVDAFLGELIDLPPPLAKDAENVQLAAARRDPKLMGDQVRRACIDLIEAYATTRPLLLVIEDFHWADRATVSLLDRVLHDMAEHPLAIVAFARPTYKQAFPDLWSQHSAIEMRLGRLAKKPARMLVRAVLGEIPDQRMDVLVDQADGNPFYLEELVRHAAAGNWDDLPETVVAMVEARLEQLAPQARHVLRAASVFGERFWRDAVVSLIGDPTGTDVWLDGLVAGEWIRPIPGGRFAGQTEYEFRHELIREVAHEMLTENDRLLGHRLAAMWLAGVEERDARVIADHFVRGDAPEMAIPYLVQATEDALARNDLDAAVRLAERAVECGASGEMLGRIRCVQVEERVWRGSASEVARYGGEAMELLPRGCRTWYRMAAETGIAWSKLGELSRAESIAAELCAGFDVVEQRADWLAATAKLSQHLLATNRSDLGSMLLAAVESEVGDLATANPVVAADIHFARAMRADVVLGDPATVLEEVQRSAACFHEIGDVRQTCLHRSNAGYAKVELGLYDEAETELRAVLSLAEQGLLDSIANGARQQLALLLVRSGSYDQAAEYARQAIEWFSAQQDERMACVSRLYLATVAIAARDFTTAEAEVRAVLEQLPDVAPLRPTALSTMARIHLLRAEYAEALEVATQAVRLFESLGLLEGDEVAMRLVYAEALQANDKPSEARLVIGKSRDHLVAQADRISRDDWRLCFLQNIPDHVRILELAESWGAEM